MKEGCRRDLASAPRRAVPARRRRAPVLEGPHRARADRGRRPRRRARARTASRAGSRVPRRDGGDARPDRGARRRRRDDAAPAPLPRAARARPPGDRPARRRDRDGQVDRRDRARLPPRHHARDVDRLHPPDDARVLLARLHAVDPLLELRGGTRAPKPEEAVRPGDRRLPRPVARRARRRARVARPGARGGLVDGARGRAPRAGPRRAAAAAEQAVVAQCILEIEEPDAHETHFYVRDANSEGVRPVARYLDRFDDIRRIQRELVSRARREEDLGDRELEHRRRRHAGARARAREGRAVERVRERRASALPVRVLRARHREGLARRRPVARPCRHRGGRGRDVLRDGGCARRAADQRSHRDRRARGGRAPAGRRHRRGGWARRSTSRSTRSRAAASSRAAARRDVDDRRGRPRLDPDAPRHVHAEDGGRSSRPRLDRPARRSRRTSARSPRRSGAT